MYFLVFISYFCFACSLFVDSSILGITKQERFIGLKDNIFNLPLIESTNISPRDENTRKTPAVYILSSYTDMLSPKNKDLMKDDKNIFYFKSKNSIVYYDKQNNEWQELLFPEFSPESIIIKKYKELTPVTYCLDSIIGDGGSISPSYQITISVTDEYYNTISLSLTLTLSAVLGMSVNPTLSYTSSYTCSVGKGQIGRLYIEPYYVDIPDFKKREVQYSTKYGIMSSDSDFEEVGGFKLLTKYKPNHYCVIEDEISNLDCDSPTHINYLTIH